MKETYRQMSKRHQSEFNNFPCFFAFSMKQFEEGMEKLGVKSESELYQGIGGMFYRRTDAPKLHEIIERNHNEMQEALHKDMDFLYHAVRYELANHEFCITEDWEPTLDTLGLEAEEIEANENMKAACLKAMNDYMANYENE